MGLNEWFTSFSISLFFFSSFLSSTSAASPSENFIQCLSTNSDASITKTVYSPSNSSYTSTVEFSIQNLLFISSATPKPQFIITPLRESHIQAAVICSKQQGYLIRVRSGGHDYEGLSYRSPKPFVIIDLINFRQITVDVKTNSAWVQAGATVGEVYYRIAEKSNRHAFPAGVCSTMGVGGHIGGGGLGFLWRKYGIAADNILDAYFIDVKGKLHDRKSMGEDLFWAIRGGGGNSFGVIVAWKIQLVPVPPVVTAFRVSKTLAQGATNLFFKWQSVAHNFPKDLLIRAIIQPVQGTIQIQFESVFQGSIGQLLPIMKTNFPELELEAKDCTEMSWINSTLYVSGLSGRPLTVLLNRSQQSKNYFENKSDFVSKAISVAELEGIWKFMLGTGVSHMMITEPMGGRMDEISESATPFPHRKGYLYNIQYVTSWQDGGASERYLESTRRYYNFMTPYVTKSPRASYLNYKDLDLGMNRNLNTSYAEARVWGEKYFKGNFARLASVKSRVDPENYFWDEQSIPPFSTY